MDLKQFLTEARSGLVDLSFSNPLLSYKQTKKRGINLRCLEPLALVQSLVSAEDYEVSLTSNPKIEIDLNASELDSRVKYTKQEAKLFIEEKGVNVLFLAVGFVTWVEDERSEFSYQSPLILIPVRLNQDGESLVKISKLDEDIQENFALIERFASLGIDVPRWSEEKGIESYFNELEALAGYPIINGVDLNKATIDIFKTQKYFMYEDLNPDFWEEELAESGKPLPEFLGRLISGSMFESSSSTISEKEIEGLKEESEPLLVKDADLSQFRTILNARNGRSFVIQGPPGTGKSQTITNLIADLIYQGKKVLFVSEKSTALNVVRDNLIEVGLGGLTLDLHDSDTRKTGVLKDLAQTIDAANNYAPDDSFSPKRYYELKEELEEIRAALSSDVANSGIRVEHLISSLENIYSEFKDQKVSFSLLDEKFSRVEAIDLPYTEFSKNLEIIKNYESLSDDISEESRFVFSHVRVPNGQAFDEIRILDLTKNIAAHFADYIGPNAPSEEVESALMTVAKKAKDQLHRESIASVLNGSILADDIREIDGIVAAFKSIQSDQNGYHSQIKGLGWTTPINDINNNLRSARPQIQHFFSPSRKKEYQNLRAQYFHEKTNDDRVEELIRAINFSQIRISEIIEQIKSQYLRKFFNDEAKKFDIAGNIDGLIQIKADLVSLESLGIFEAMVNSTSEELADVLNFLGAEQYSSPLESKVVLGFLKDLSAALNSNDLSTLPKHILGAVLASLPVALESNIEWNEFEISQGLIEAKKLQWAVDQNICLPSRAYAYRYFKNLKSLFDENSKYSKELSGTLIESKRDEYRQLDLLRKIHSKNLILKRQQDNIKGLLSQPSANFVALNKIFKKSRNIPSIRRVIQNCFEEISAIKPIFMMSPLSVATFIPRQINYFDYLIFDEASQIKPSDALGAILRCKSTIIVGDSMQLPPTRIFDADSSSVDSASELYDDFDFDNSGIGLVDIPSILDLASSLRIPEFKLNWHYRSKFANLIAVSNKEFYEDSLVTFPDAKIPLDNEGVRFTFIENGNYERSTTRKNPNEAIAVVEAIFEHIKNNPERSLGVATFSVAQKEAIEEHLFQTQERRDLLDQFNKRHPKEDFFVKNIERIQGDERDCIFISIGYGRSSNSTSGSINFGPLSQNGGDKRLNVLISRAKYLCRVFSSIHYYDIPAATSAYPGVERLKKFLKFAETGEIDLPSITGGDYDSEFERSVANALRNRGYVVDGQVGSSGFKIDLAIRHPSKEGEYLCGVECDGATYHSSLTARERDRIRQEILESRGWTILRIWSTDWFRGRERELKKIEQKLSEMIGS
jgi:hypothetical protein